MSTAPHLWRKFWTPVRTAPSCWWSTLPQSQRPGRGRARTHDHAGADARPALGMMRAVVDAGLHDDAWCREHAEADELLQALNTWRRSAPPR